MTQMPLKNDVRETERELNIKFIRQNVQQLHKLSYSSNIETLFYFHSLRVEYNIQLLLNSALNCENIHKKHTGSH